ncbi:MAG: succinate dehydrogenase/fumarate reductase iron-sulfur subunit [Chloroflexota bacterium]|jgi:succinate dehydrogenase / fumarate reductase iron-sulfur subunit
MTERTVQFKVLRYKQGQPAPSYQTFDVTVNDDTTVLVALQDIRRDQDPTLILRHSCHHASCGTCGMKVNGQSVLACVVKVLELGTSTVVVEPLDNLPLVADLVVDMSGFYERYTTPEMPYLRQSEFLPGTELPEGIEQHRRYENCLECGICVSACPVAGSDLLYLGPAAMAAAGRVVEEPRGSDPGFALDWVDNDHGCWRCHVAYECSEACPSDVDPAGQIMALRGALTKRKIGRLFGRR